MYLNQALITKYRLVFTAHKILSHYGFHLKSAYQIQSINNKKLKHKTVSGVEGLSIAHTGVPIRLTRPSWLKHAGEHW